MEQVILFDGICNFCNSSINFVIDRDHKNVFKFAALQSEAGQILLQKYHFPTDKADSVMLLKNGKVYEKSTAVLEIARTLGGFWQVFYIFIVIPPFIRNFFYDLIAKNRYKLFGKKDTCRIPTPELKAKFL
jgi:predicted DCC family thiol-disulfide oxidoreductase YuxK